MSDGTIFLSQQIVGGVWRTLSIPATSTATCDTVPLSHNHAAKWIVFGTIDDVNFKSEEILAIASNSDVKYSVYSILGEEVDFEVDVILVGSNIVFNVINSEASELTIKIKRL